MIEVMTKEKFSIIIEELVRDHKLTYLDAVLHWCEKNTMEVETAAKLISPLIKQKMTVECQELRMIKQEGAKLPI
jgi:hypothetical protein